MTKSSVHLEFENSDTIPLLCNKEYLKWSTLADTMEEFHVLRRLSKDNTDFFTSKLGPCDFTCTDSANLTIHVWRVQVQYGAQNGIIWMLTAPERGTSYEVQGNLKFEAIKYTLTKLVLED